MKCPACGNGETKVLDSRVIDDGKGIRRRRSCEYCEHRFTTFEKIAITDFLVIKKDGSKEVYDRDKLKRALIIAFGKKQVSLERIEELISGLETKRSALSKEIPSTQIGADVLEALKQEDEVAYVRFASVFMDFSGIEDFNKFLNTRK